MNNTSEKKANTKKSSKEISKKEKKNIEEGRIQIPFVLEGNSDEWKIKGMCLTELDRRKLLRAAGKYESIKEYLISVKNGIYPDNIGILLKLPYTSYKRYCMVGPVFAALLLREYNLAKELIDRIRNFEFCGLFLNDGYDTYSDSVFTDDHIWIPQLFLADLNIPSDILLKLLDRLENDHITVSYYKEMLDNDLLRMLNRDYEYNYGNDPFSDTDKDSAQGSLYEKLCKKCPRAYEWLFKPFVTGIGSEDISIYGNLKWIQKLRDTVYRHYSENNSVILGMFTLEVRKFIEVYCVRLITEKECLRLYKSACFVLSKITEDEALLKWYLKLILFMLNVFDHKEKFRIWLWTDEREILIGNKLVKLLKKGMSIPSAKSFDAEDLCMHNGTREGNIYFEDDICRLYMYYPGYLETYKKYLGKKTDINAVGDMFAKHLQQICFRDFFITEREIYDFKQALKIFFFNVDRFYLKPGYKKREINAVWKKYKDNLKNILDIADEEIILLGFKKHLLTEENIEMYIEMAIQSKQTSILPCLFAYCR